MHDNEMKIEWSSMTTALPFEPTQLQPFSAFAPVVELWSAMEENIIGLGIIVRNTDGVFTEALCRNLIIFSKSITLGI